MRILEKPEHWWKGLLAGCQYCGALVEFEGLDDEVKVHEAGDFKDEGTVKWRCGHCHEDTYSSYSRMREDSERIKKRSADQRRLAYSLVITG